MILTTSVALVGAADIDTDDMSVGELKNLRISSVSFDDMATAAAGRERRDCKGGDGGLERDVLASRQEDKRSEEQDYMCFVELLITAKASISFCQ